MGFFKFLKREKKQDEWNEFDLPPEPPKMEEFDEKTFPDFPEMKDLGAKEPEDFKFDFEDEKDFPKFSDNGMKDFQDFKDFDVKPVTDIPQIRAPAGQMPEPEMAPEPVPIEYSYAEESQVPEPLGGSQGMIEMPAQATEQKPAVLPQDHAMRQGPYPKSVYVKVENFKATLGNINMVRSDLRKSEEALAKLEKVKTGKDRSFDKVKTDLEDLQKKLIFVDKILFKGD